MNKIILTYLWVTIAAVASFAQQPEQRISIDTTVSNPSVIDSAVIDSAVIDTGFVDTTLVDTALVDTLAEEKPMLEAPINYNASDSMVISLDGQKVRLYNNAKVTYQNIELTAYYIELNLDTNEVFATGALDSTGKMIQKPLFKQGSDEYESESMRYNFDTEKAFITKVVTQQGEGYMHSERTKKIDKNVFITKNAKYTTCDAEHPHFYLRLTKAKVISNNRVITGPAFMVLEDFPIYFPFLPFGYFPSTPSYSSGIIIPTYGEESNRGFYLRDGGYYWAANQYFDLTFLGSIYSKGSWGTTIKTKYKKRYKFSGNFSFDYAITKYEDYKSKQMKLVWSHTQDAKANPNQSFSASVNFSTSGYEKENATYSTDYLTTTKSSSISYSRQFENTPFSVSANLRHSQNSSDSTMTLSLPVLTLTMSKVYPFKRKNRQGKTRFYEKFGITYTGNFKNYISAKEDEILNSSFSKDWKNGIKHNIPIAFPSFNLFKYFSFSPGISYNEKWYFKKYNYTYDPNGGHSNSLIGKEYVKVDTITGLNRVYNYSYSLSSSTNIYGIFQPRNPNSRVVAIRHKMTPTISFSYTPDFGRKKFGYWKEVQIDSTGATSFFDVNKGGVYGGSPSRGESGSISFSLSNSLEMKKLNTARKANADSTQNNENEKYKKVKLIDNLSISSSYNLVADSLNLSVFNIRARTTVAGVSITSSAVLDPYMVDENYTRINKFCWNERSGFGKLGRLTSASLSFGMDFGSKDKNKKGGSEGENENQEQSPDGASAKPQEEPLPSIYDNYADFSMPWSLGFDYSFRYTGKSSSYPNGKFSQTIGVNGKLSITKKWQLTASTNFDIEAGEFSYTRFNLTRDLHCWGMSFSFVPFGYRRSYSFTLSCNSSMLADLKIRKNKSFYDN